MHRFIIFLAFIIATPSLWANAQSPEDIAKDFYSLLLTDQSAGLPSQLKRKQLVQSLSPAIINMLEAASKIEAQCTRSTTDGDKPHVVEGDIFVSNYEGATEVAFGDVQKKGEEVIIESTFIYIDTRFSKAHPHRTRTWRDTLVMRRIDGRWYVYDIRFLNNTSLVANIKAYIKEGQRSCVTGP